MRTMLEIGRTGLIAAETDIKKDELLHFGWTLLKFILESKLPLIDAIDKARKTDKFWPKSILYGVYCDPVNIYFNPPPEEEIEKADRFLNFVMEKICSKNGDENK